MTFPNRLFVLDDKSLKQFWKSSKYVCVYREIKLILPALLGKNYFEAYLIARSINSIVNQVRPVRPKLNAY